MGEINKETHISDTQDKGKKAGLANRSKIQKSASFEEIQERLSTLIFIKYSKLFYWAARKYKSLADSLSKASNCYDMNTKIMIIAKFLIGIIASFIYSNFILTHDDEFPTHQIYFFFIFVFLLYISFFWISNEMILSSIFASILGSQIILTRLKNLSIDVKAWVCILMYPIQYALIRKPISCRFSQYFPLIVFINPVYFFALHLPGYSYLAMIPFAIYPVIQPIIDYYLFGLRYYDVQAYRFIKQLSTAIEVAVAFIATCAFSLLLGYKFSQKLSLEKLFKAFHPIPFIVYLFPMLICGTPQSKYYLFSAIILIIVPRDAENGNQSNHAIIDALLCIAFEAFESILNQNNFYFRYFALFVLLSLSFVKLTDI
ncbi:hypothetical protein TVAG_199570 [Trichomonas vaginalis G3]|uniref:Uncharacterized protein n=1 Tax=Trichomonas vaginalis (strain ATCC PRA-98 / G3) TaxID=412133 RepID=A2DDZ2_TRIV3|nr:hypothetical protein TVAGG3_1000190 [Trichomonas vaginalis G3]EAY21518.1 hypothetical protein TVAG_199570 [Trichomonas vaginalis G3]KAI5490734.1 hypothetical protein TVAGG3_1000190 [Trichomonas vaginalis G3]|eukprot:XP_001582504.1 hypothetical protein [Trichomonas vaginalis G3]